MRRAQSKIEPQNIIAVDVNEINVCIVVRVDGAILDLINVPTGYNLSKTQEHDLKQVVLTIIDELIVRYNIDTILLEQCKLLTDKISLNPDFFVLSNILLKYSIQITLEDKYMSKVKYFIELPQYDWMSTVFNRKFKYAVDLFKDHVEQQSLIVNEDLLNKMKVANFYKVICLSETIFFINLMNKKYLINKTRSKDN